MFRSRAARARLLLAAAAAVFSLGTSSPATAAVTITSFLDVYWVVHDSPTGCAKGQHVYLSYAIAGVGYYRIEGGGYNSSTDAPYDEYWSYDTGPIFVNSATGSSLSGTVELWGSTCHSSTSHGRGYGVIRIHACDVDCATGGSSIVTSDVAYCHWGHDVYCYDESGT